MLQCCRHSSPGLCTSACICLHLSAPVCASLLLLFLLFLVPVRPCPAPAPCLLRRGGGGNQAGWYIRVVMCCGVLCRVVYLHWLSRGTSSQPVPLALLNTDVHTSSNYYYSRPPCLPHHLSLPLPLPLLHAPPAPGAAEGNNNTSAPEKNKACGPARAQPAVGTPPAAGRQNEPDPRC